VQTEELENATRHAEDDEAGRRPIADPFRLRLRTVFFAFFAHRLFQNRVHRRTSRKTARSRALIGRRWRSTEWTLGTSIFSGTALDFFRPAFEQGLLRIRRRHEERTPGVEKSPVAIAAPSMKLSERRVPQVVVEKPARYLGCLESGEPRVGAFPLGKRDRTI